MIDDPSFSVVEPCI
jgi:hypothetical protein